MSLVCTDFFEQGVAASSALINHHRGGSSFQVSVQAQKINLNTQSTDHIGAAFFAGQAPYQTNR
jgi:hypothetical protein